MNYRQLPLRIITGIGLVCLLQHVCVQSYGDNSVAPPDYPIDAPTTREYALLDAQTVFNCKHTEYSWQWIDGDKGVVGYKGRSEISVMRDLCHRIATRKVDAQSHKARNTHLLLLDTIGAQGWEMVEHSELVQDFPMGASDKSAKTPNTSTVIARKWLFKRAKAVENF